MKHFLLIVCLIFFSYNQKVEAACTGLSIVANDLGLEWDFNWTIHAITIQLTKTDPASCTFGLGFSTGGAGSYTRVATRAGGDQLKYQIYQDSGATRVLKDVPDLSSANEVIMVTMPAGNNNTTQTYYFDIPYATATAPVLVHSGDYLDSFIINAYEGADYSSLVAPADATAQVDITLTVPKMINIAMVDTGGVFVESATAKSIEFGQLSTGKTARFDLVLRTNAGSSITVASSNTGRMKHLTKNSYIDYKLYVNNVESDPTGATPVLTTSGQTSMAGIGYPVKIVIGTVGVLSLAGSYQDTVVITATAVE